MPWDSGGSSTPLARRADQISLDQNHLIVHVDNEMVLNFSRLNNEILLSIFYNKASKPARLVLPFLKGELIYEENIRI